MQERMQERLLSDLEQGLSFTGKKGMREKGKEEKNIMPLYSHVNDNFAVSTCYILVGSSTSVPNPVVER